MTNKKCFDNVDNYANLNNSLQIKNSLTARFTWLYLEDTDQLFLADQSTIPSGDSILSVDVTVSDGVTSVLGAGVGDPAVQIDVSTLDASSDKWWRIDYLVTSTNGLTDTATAFFQPSEADQYTDSSDPNAVPLSLTQILPDVADHPVQIYEHVQAVASTVWTINHNAGQLRPLSFELYNSLDQRMFTSFNLVDSNTLTVTFASAKSGRALMIFKS